MNHQNTALKNLLLATIIIVSISSCSNKIYDTSNRSHKLEQQIIGTWALCNIADSLIITNYDNREGQKRLKMITPESFIVVDYIDKPNEMFNAFMGSYLINNNNYTEFIQHTGTGYKRYLGEKNRFVLKIEGDYMYITEIDEKYSPELWKRLN